MPLDDPWFWAFLGSVGWGLGFAVVGSQTLGRRPAFGVVTLAVAEVPRFLLPLPFVIQPRLDLAPLWLGGLGMVVFVGSWYFATPVFRIAPLTAADRRRPLRTDGLYRVVRHPLMVCDALWPLGWSLVFGSLIGVALTPAWLLLIWGLTHVEEEALVREYGDAYRAFQSRVPRLVPRLRRSARMDAQ